jgi:hypothetical protein
MFILASPPIPCRPGARQPGFMLQGRAQRAVEDNDAALGFALRDAPEAGAAISTPALGPCVVQGDGWAFDAQVTGWRELPCGLRGLRLSGPASAFLNCAVVTQGGRAVAVAQATPDDLWGFPLDLLLLADGPPEFFPVPLQLLEGFSVTYKARLLSISGGDVEPRRVDFLALAGQGAPELRGQHGEQIAGRVRRAKPFMPSDTYCLCAAGILVGPGCVVLGCVGGHQLPARARVSYANGVELPSMAQLQEVLGGGESFLLAAGGGVGGFRAEAAAPFALAPGYVQHRNYVSWGAGQEVSDWEEEEAEEEPEPAEEEEEEDLLQGAGEEEGEPAEQEDEFTDF